MAKSKIATSKSAKDKHIEETESESEEEEEDEEYEVQDILDKAIKGGKVLYHVKWKGFPLEDATWEPIENLENAAKLIKNFEAKHGTDAKKPTKSATGKPPKEKKEKKSASSLLDQSKKIKKRPKEGKKETKGPGRKPKSEPVVGSFEKDQPSRLVDHGIVEDDNERILNVTAKTPFRDIYFLVEWKKRSDNVEPTSAYYPFTMIKAKHPDLLLDYIASNMNYSDN